MRDKLDDEFYASDVENFLIDSDILSSGSVLPGPKTGPKGVLEDYKRYKELCKVEEAIAEKEKIAWHKQAAFTADPNKHPDKGSDEDFEDDDFLKKYHEKRLNQLKKEMDLNQNKSKFGKLFELNGNELLSTIDKEDQKLMLRIF